MATPANVQQLAHGLYRWIARHPDWRPGAEPGGPDDWGPSVACHCYEAPDTVVLFDPLLPSEDRDGFLAWLDELSGARPVSVLTTIRWHRRDRELLAERYASRSSRAWNYVPRGVEQKPLRGAGETVYWLPAPAALVFGDRLIGDDNGDYGGEGGGGSGDGGGGSGDRGHDGDVDARVHLPPESWLRGVPVDRGGLARLMRPLTELPVELLLVSHGEPVVRDGRAELARAIRDVEQS